uniref:Uncharacterized protein n=1 Tax=Populus trichocarpa TaxID=3694 RepID=A0A2K2AQ47_POPTR
MGSEAKKQGQQRRIQVKSKSYLHSGDTKHVIAGMGLITLVFGVPWYLINRDDILSGLIFYASEAVRSHVVEAWQGLSILR